VVLSEKTVEVVYGVRFGFSNSVLLSGRNDLLAALLLDAGNSAAKELMKTVGERLSTWKAPKSDLWGSIQS